MKPVHLSPWARDTLLRHIRADRLARLGPRRRGVKPILVVLAIVFALLALVVAPVIAFGDVLR